ncbi:MAG TPA: hypothetical protein VG708_08395 [Mycobacteriales bacterium]|nr:hypothetical protein [Mycobacteriales bacterium]
MDALQRAAHPQYAGVEVDVRPLQAERLALPEPKGEGDRPAGRVPPPGRGVEYSAGLGRAERLDLLPVDTGRVDQGGDVAGDPAAAVRDLQRPRDDPVHLQHAGRCHPVVMAGPVERFQMFGLQLVDPQMPERRDDPAGDVAAVAGQRRRTDLSRRDGVDVERQPLAETDRLRADLHRAGITSVDRPA